MIVFYRRHPFCFTVEPRFNKPLFNEVLDIMNNIQCRSYSKMYGIEPRDNEFIDITNIMRKPKPKNLPRYNDITNYINLPQYNKLMSTCHRRKMLSRPPQQ